ncbi:Ribosomal RNA large subunit methyltransferase K [Chlamydiales bacterium STE3]|nr:Ribosomal RNA large subunit methyltransferase K [Chlamydiales bacterium STE3]
MTILPLLADGEDKSSPFVNCLRNNYKHLRKWAKRTETDCFRIYDREIASYPLAIDFYAGRFCVHYFSKSLQEEVPKEMQEEVSKALEKIFGRFLIKIYWRIRARKKETRQYEKINEEEEFFVVHEYGVKFWVNLADYLDTGLFLDHRETRRLVAAHSKNQRLLNLFAYTCSFSVHAAFAGAAYTKSVDLSNTYTRWGEQNFLLNEFSLENNVVEREDCLKFLDGEARTKNRYSLIVVDPPTISRSKKMDKMFDVQEDYVQLLKKALKLLSTGGILFFSTNSRKFVFDVSLFPQHLVEEISYKTLPIDFKDKKIHRCWKFQSTS